MSVVIYDSLCYCCAQFQIIEQHLDDLLGKLTPFSEECNKVLQKAQEISSRLGVGVGVWVCRCVCVCVCVFSEECNKVLQKAQEISSRWGVVCGCRCVGEGVWVEVCGCRCVGVGVCGCRCV